MTITATGFVVTTTEAIFVTGATRDEAWIDAVQFLDDRDDRGDGPEDYNGDVKIYPATAALIAEVARDGGAIAWGRVKGVCCTIAERDEAEG